jgi:hypothetical protein
MIFMRNMAPEAFESKISLPNFVQYFAESSFVNDTGKLHFVHFENNNFFIPWCLNWSKTALFIGRNSCAV